MKKFELPLKFSVVFIIIFIIGSGMYYCNNITVNNIDIVDNTKTEEEILQDKKLSLININIADKETLNLLPGIGDVLSQRIIDYRNNNGNFKNIEDLKNVDGIGEKTFEKIKTLITL